MCLGMGSLVNVEQFLSLYYVQKLLMTYKFKFLILYVDIPPVGYRGSSSGVSCVVKYTIHYILWKKAKRRVFILNDTNCMVCCT